jgi:hypothetical protein
MSVAAREAAILRRLISEVLQKQYSAITLYKDNQREIDLLREPPGTDFRTKHIDVRFHYIRQEVNRSAIMVFKIPTEHQATDSLIKPLDRLKHTAFKQLFGIVDCNNIIEDNG